MSQYTGLFAQVYDRYWPAFGKEVAPLIFDIYRNSEPGRRQAPLLDLCCGNGDLALFFLEQGIAVTGVDISPDMLEIARAKAAPFVEKGTARFITADVTRFSTDEKFGMVCSTYDSFNHLPNLEQVWAAFRNAAQSLHSDGLFVFDMNTRKGLEQFNGFNLLEREEALIITRGIFHEAEQRSVMRISGFIRDEEARYQRFEETLVNYVYPLKQIEEGLRQAGFREIRVAALHDISATVSDPESEERVLLIASLQQQNK